MVGLREIFWLSAVSVALRVRIKFLLFKQVVEKVSRHIGIAEGAENVKIIVDVHAENPGGFSESIVRTVNGNSRVLGFEARELQCVQW